MPELALTGVAQWVGHHPQPKVAGSIPDQDTGLCCGFDPWWGLV